MISYQTPLSVRFKGSVMLPLLLACLLVFSQAGAQVPGPLPSIYTFGTRDTSMKRTVSYDQILATPGIFSSDPKYTVQEFTISFLPKGKDYRGPYTLIGAKLTPQVIEIIKELKLEANPRTRIFIERITVAKDGVQEILRPVIMEGHP